MREKGAISFVGLLLAFLFGHAVISISEKRRKTREFRERYDFAPSGLDDHISDAIALSEMPAIPMELTGLLARNRPLTYH